MFKQLHPNIRARIIISFFSKIVGASILPFMAIYFTSKINAPIAGILLIINIIFQFIASIYGGFLADNIGRRKLQVVGEWAKVIALLGMVISNSVLLDSPWITFLMLLIVSIAQGIILPASESMLIDVSKPETRAYMYSLNYWVSNLSMMIGIILGGWFFKAYLFNLLVFLFSLSILTAILTSKMITETLVLNTELKKENFNLINIFKSYKVVIGDYRFILFTLGGIMLMSIEFQRDNYIAVRLSQDFSPILLDSNSISMSIDGLRMLSIITIVNMLFIIIFTSIVAKYVSQNREMKMYIGFLLFTIGYLLCSISNNLIILILATVILSIGELIYVPIRQSILSEIIDENKRAEYMALNSLVMQIGKFIATTCLFISPYLNKFMIAILILVFGILSILFTLLALKKKRKHGINVVPKSRTN